MARLSIIIPTVNDPALEKTIDDIRRHAKTNPEIIPVLGTEIGMRSAINLGVSKASGEYIAKCDDHCAFDEAFDIKMLQKMDDDMIQVPVRYALDVDTWQIMTDSPAVHEKLVVLPDNLKGARWISKTKQMQDFQFTEDMMFQGSFYMMSRKLWDRLGGLQTRGYGEFAQEAVELSLRSWDLGAKVWKNKTTWYAHKHRKFGRHKVVGKTREANRFSFNHWKDTDTLKSYLEYFGAN